MVPFGTINYYFLLLLSKAKKKILTDINTMISNLVFFLSDQTPNQQSGKYESWNSFPKNKRIQ